MPQTKESPIENLAWGNNMWKLFLTNFLLINLEPLEMSVNGVLNKNRNKEL